MRILLALEWHPFSVGGVQSHVRDLASYLSRLGYEVFVISKDFNSQGVTKYQYTILKYYTVKSLLPFNTIIVPPDPVQLKKLIRRIEPDIIHAHHAFTFIPLLSLRIAEIYKIPRILTNHSVMLGYDYKLLWKTSSYILLPYRYYISRAQVIISVSRAANKFISKFIGDGIRRVIIPNGVDTERFKPSNNEFFMPTILFLGRLVYRKGAHVLLKAFELIVREEPEARLIIAGRGYMMPILKTLSVKYGIKDKVIFKGYVSEEEKPELYKSSSIVAIPSIYGESFGIVTLEALASGKPVVASNIGGLQEIITDGEEGFLIPPNSPKDLAERVIMLLQDKKLYKNMSRCARAKAESMYSWKKIVCRILEEYLRLIECER